MTNQLVLLESRTAREDHLTDLDDNRALEAINKAKALVMAMWQGTGIATTAQMAEYYEVSEATLRAVVKRNREELTSDGLKTLKGKALQESCMMQLSEDGAVALTIWPPRAALRLGMLLRDSLVAQKVRTILLDVAEQQPINDNLFQKQVSKLTEVITNLADVVAASIKPKHKALPKATVDPVPGKIQALTERQCINQLIRGYVFHKNQNLAPGEEKKTEQGITRWMYRELKTRYKFDVYARFKNCTYTRKIDLIEAEGQLANLHTICNHFLGN
jgi:hypothetical protein